MQTLESCLDEAEIAANSVSKTGVRAVLFGRFLVLGIGARKSFSRLYLSQYPILGRFLSQFEALIGRKETVAPGTER